MNIRNLYLLLFNVGLAQTMTAQTTLPSAVSNDWYASATAAITTAQSSFKQQKTANHFIVANTTNQLGFSITEKGYTVNNIRRNDTEENWNASFEITTAGNWNAALQTATAFKTTCNSTTLTYESSSFAIEYLNNEDGLRQNFIIKEKPAGDEKLHITIAVTSALMAEEISPNQMALYTPGNKKDIQLIYDQLKVWDANQQALPAEMNFNKTTKEITITVDDSNAIYPVTVDPLNRNPEWTTSADGILPSLLTNLQLQVNTNYGYTVAGLGDINGDGYDDVAIGAPTMADVIAGTGSLTAVGAVFVYLGSPAGISATPSKILQPSTAVNGALFGYSIDAGDITGDGRNDIVISAPLDRYQTTAAALLGSVNVNVTAGKVYVYRSEDLAAASNPSPFLQLRLQGSTYFSNGVAGLLLSNINVHALFGYSVAVTQDLNGDNRADIIIGAPAYLGIDLLAVQNGAAFVYFSDSLSTTAPLQLQTPTPTLLGLPLLPLANTNGLLFGFSTDGAGDFNNDGFADIVVGAPAGVDLSSLNGIFSGQFLGGSAYVYYGTGTGINTSSTVRLQASASGLLSNTANLFGFKVKGTENAAGIKTGGILIGAPAGAVLSNVVNGLQVKAGQVHVFTQKNSGTTGALTADQALASPRSSSILSLLSGQTLNLSLLYGASIDNMLDVNCDNIGDIIVGEPLSTAVTLVSADVVGGAAYVYLGNANGTYSATPNWDHHTTVSPLIGLNTTSLMGYSVAGAGHVRGTLNEVRSLIGGPSNALDFGTGLLNLGNTLSTTLDFTFDNNGLGKSYSFAYNGCGLVTLPATLLSFSGKKENTVVKLNWVSATEVNLNYYELQRSNDGVNFSTLSMVFASNLSHNEYNYTDKQPYSGKNYYRLKMIDNDGRFVYSDLVLVKDQSKQDIQLTVSPNPVSSMIQCKIAGLEKGTYSMQLISQTGQVVARKIFVVAQGTQYENWQVPASAANGIYQLNVYDAAGQKRQLAKIIITH